jgi:hypothetical protein
MARTKLGKFQVTCMCQVKVRNIISYDLVNFSFFHESFLAGYSFAVLSNVFVVHLDHPINRSKAQKHIFKGNTREWKQQFSRYLYGKYGFK